MQWAPHARPGAATGNVCQHLEHLEAEPLAPLVFWFVDSSRGKIDAKSKP